uniref:NADH-ubiquinone oxidoreductase chain 4L n=1 Tax=Oopsacas minuta TaxID=111878 RepID=A0A0G3ZCB0_9METZ|nr:NADH dehydrogenase subunit 4L [Oopsacas minuta]AKM54873.1 NADH dehydrogenase subunit 4L [Oopsacas minuta]
MTHELISTTSILMMLMSMCSMLLNFRNLMILLMTMEMMLLALCLMLSTHTHTLLLTLSTMMILQMLTIAAAETAMGLSMLMTYYRTRGTMTLKSLNLLRG